MSAITPALRAAILAALFHHECGGRDDVAYRLSFARLGKSGGSFGKLQADCHADPIARTVIGQILRGAGMPADRARRILEILVAALPRGWPGAAADLAAINAAIAAPAGRKSVDALDQTILTGLVADLEHCAAAAARRGATVEPAALIAMALWINQFGRPTELLRWLGGGAVTLGGREIAPPPGAAVTEAQFISGYVAFVPFETAHPGQIAALRDAVAVGVAALSTSPRLRTAPPAASAEISNQVGGTQ
jgi:hypothetical protein